MLPNLPDWRRWSSALAIASVAWVVALAVATVAAGRPSEGPVAYAVSSSVYAAASLVCHQRPERSFFLGDVQFPVCARCAGLYVGAVAVLVLTAFRARLRSVMPSTTSARLVVVAAAVPTLLTLAFEWGTGQAPSNWLRAAAGFPLGAGVAWVIAALDVTGVPGHSASAEVH